MSKIETVKWLDMEALLVENPQIALSLSHLGNLDQEKLPFNLAASQQINYKPIHYNRPQIRSMLIGANEEYDVWGRGTGKSEGLIAPRSKRNTEVMPLSRGAFIGRTYLKLLENTLPPVIKGWEALGWRRGRDFWIREKPPKSLNVPSPIVGALDSLHTIYCKNGSVISLISQDRAGSANSMTLHWMMGDEAKFLKKDKLDTEIFPANRGDGQYFGDIPEFHSILFATDMPTTKEGMWILEKKKEVDLKRIELLLAIQLEIFKLTNQLTGASPTRHVGILSKIKHYQKQWDAIRANTVYYSVATTLDNIEAFGVKNFQRLEKILPRFIFLTALMSVEPNGDEHTFYPDLSERHCYDAVDYGYVDGFEFGQWKLDDCRKDSDCDKDRPIEMALDYNSSINPIAIGQLFGMELKFINALYVKKPLKLKDAVKLFCDYYRPHRSHYVRFYYDHTAIGTDSSREFSYKDEVQNILIDEGYEVEMIYIGVTPSYEFRYEKWGVSLNGGDEETPAASFNRTNTDVLITAMKNTHTRQTSKGFEKNKLDERKQDVDQLEAPHFSDAADTLLCGVSFRLKHRNNSDLGSVTT